MNEPIHQRRILELLEVCRPDRADQADPMYLELAAAIKDDPELERLWQCIGQIDARLVAALRDAPPPEGLAERILERLATIQPSPPTVTSRSTIGGEQGVPERPVDRRRRKLLAVAGSVLVAVAACLFVAVWLASPNSQTVSSGQVLNLAITLFNYEQDFVERFDWRPIAEAPDEYPLSAFVAQEGQIRWRHLDRANPEAPQLDWQGVAYDFVGPQRVRATLYVFRAAVDNLPGTPPAYPVLSTGMCSAAIWQEGSLVYVLVVRGGAEEYRQFVPIRPGQIA